MIASPHRLASEAGAHVLRDGGNAIDAVIAANAVLCVVYPHMTSVAGDLMAIVWPAGASAPIGLVGAGRSGELATIDAVRRRGHAEMPERGALSVTVPGTVEAWGRLIERFGSLGWASVLEPAIAIAREGYEVTAHVSEALHEAAGLLEREPAAHDLYPPVKAGTRLRNADLATVLSDIARHGFNGFYRGEIASAIAAAIARRDGFVTARDLAGHRSEWVETVTIPYRDVVVHELPPPTQGLIALELLHALNMQPALQPGPDFAAMFLAATSSAYRIRDQITDPEFAPAPIPARGEVREGGDTCYLCAADEHGNLVSLIQSVAFDFGSGIVAEGTGMLLQNRGSYFSLDPNHANRLEPKKRTRHTLIPALATREGRPWLLYGSMGGDGQPQLQTQVLINIVDHGMEPQEAVARPRIRVSPDGKTLTVEADNQSSVDLLFGHAHAIVIDGPGSWRAGCDPRSDGSVERVG
ncbi:MAG TPA: gamma-glutamyltransferase family protein [Candidatus Dormibacteraeota bacterium]